MNNLLIKGSSKTPEVSLTADGQFNFDGISMPEDAASFYLRIMDWISDYYRSPHPQTTVNISFKYINSSSSSMMFKIFYCLDRLQATGKTQINCHWKYDSEDDGMHDYIERVQRYADRINFKVEAVEELFKLSA